MAETKLTVRIPREVIEAAKRYAREHDTTLTRLVSQYLRRLDDPVGALADAPIVRRLSGVLSTQASVEEYQSYLVDKCEVAAEGPD